MTNKKPVLIILGIGAAILLVMLMTDSFSSSTEKDEPVREKKDKAELPTPKNTGSVISNSKGSVELVISGRGFDDKNYFDDGIKLRPFALIG